MKIEKLMQQVKEKEPLVQCITNFVTVNDCANILLSIGATPTMAMDCREVEEAVAKVSALVCNMGAIEHLESMLLAGKEANRLHIPVVLDPVGAGYNFETRGCKPVDSGGSICSNPWKCF